MGVSQKYSRRYHELLDAGELLFTQKGYEQTTVNDILQHVGIGKGTFYHYFTSKEEVMDEVIMRVVRQLAEAARKVQETPALSAQEKFKRIIIGQPQEVSNLHPMIAELHRVENARMHQKSIVETIKVLSPILSDVIIQGIEEGTFSTPYPYETVEILLVANQFIFDHGIFSWSFEQQMKKARAFVYSMETLLGATPGSFNYLLDLFKNNNGEQHDSSELF